MNELLDLYRTMVRIRAFEDAAEAASQGGVSWGGAATEGAEVRVKGPLHLSTGQEAVAAGVCAHLHARDLLTSTHRGHGHTLAKGADPTKMMCELFGRASGYNGGKGGSMHIADFSVGMLGANGVVTAGLPIAVGAAHGLKIRGADAIAVSFFGDGAINRGPFLEALNWAQIYRLPVLFVCEDNRISATTPSAPMTAGEQAASARAEALGIAAVQVDGNDVQAVSDAARQLIAGIRAGSGPRLLHAQTYRLKGHVSVDPASYRDPAEVAAARQNDPIDRARERLRALGLGEQAEQIERAALEEITTAVATASAAPLPAAEAAYSDVVSIGEGAWT
ncbi:thiamine pyrophosphate-dependent dehydrogenase E1 component subunit alpha [Melaminivora jejuensis]|uniref:thiamine pyrophosphate-dependent dehydrogenase E1 component subunit alpha n=1 Tax=Melaminivora jejuensis TaxID=1267217 RepID=UPI001E52B254|nr:thiamine pyrophosphate-dependent dehydrogenase E1 component subunit alpha [Melaminivora jejuensis]UHJ64468.1 thiamine pyrophosphate-dependent dehydrogenase E1 component subunit alpha [Melaminivora jejuensis]